MDRLERTLKGRAQVVRLNLADHVGRALAVRYDVRGVPTFLVFNDSGEVVYTQVGPPNRERIVAEVEGALAAP